MICRTCERRESFSYHPHCVECICSGAYPHIGYSYEPDELAAAQKVFDMTDKADMSIQRATAIIDNVPGKFGDEDEIIQILIDLLKSEQILDVAIALEHWKQRREAQAKRIVRQIAADMAMLDEEDLDDLEKIIEEFDSRNGERNDTKH